MWALGFAMLVLGFLLTTQYKVTQIANAPKPTDLRAEEISKELTATKNKLQAAERENNDLKAQIDKLTKAGGGNVVQVPQRDPNLELLAGTTQAKGKGIIVTVAAGTDGDAKTGVLDSDLWKLTNELWAAGAEGMAINGQRLTTTTEIRRISGRMMINQVMTTSPYEVDAVGNPQVLEVALRMPGGVVAELSKYGLRINIVKSDSVVLPSFGSPPNFQFLKPNQ
jgi:uncharacterized protein YlxW (UPF0749 family)